MFYSAKSYESSFSSVKPLKMFSFQLHVFFIIRGKRNVKSTSFDEKIPEVTFVFINKSNFEKNGKLNKIVVSNWLFNSTEAGFHSQIATFIKKSFFSPFKIQSGAWKQDSVIKLHFARNLHKYWNLQKVVKTEWKLALIVIEFRSDCYFHVLTIWKLFSVMKTKLFHSTACSV